MDEREPTVLQEFRELLAGGKYTRWAANITTEQLALVLWCVGEFGIRMPHQRSLPVRFQSGALESDGELRAMLALETLAKAVHGEPLSRDQWKRELDKRLSARGSEGKPQ